MYLYLPNEHLLVTLIKGFKVSSVTVLKLIAPTFRVTLGGLTFWTDPSSTASSQQL